MIKTYLITGFISIFGVVVFLLLHLPLPFLFGPLFACLIAALLGVKLKAYKPLNETMRTILGVAVGATVTVAFIVNLTQIWTTLILIPIMVTLIGLIGVPYFQRIWGYDWATSYYAAMPGGLQDMLAFGEEAGGNVRTMSLIHATRVLIIVIALPILLSLYWGADLTNPPGVAAKTLPISQMIIMAFCAIAGWQFFKWIGMFGASILGPLIVTAIATVIGLLQHRPPAEAIWIAQFFIGLTVGAKYVGITGAEIRRDVVAALGYCAILIVLTIIFVALSQYLELAPSRETILSLAPGGQAEMVILALIVGADMSFVVAHHLLRIFVVILGAPVFALIFKSD